MQTELGRDCLDDRWGADQHLRK